jgi:uncharacterized membrane protein
MPNLSLKKLGASTRYLVVVAAVLVFSGWLLNTPPGLMGKADAIGYAVCHRIGERSFHVGQYQLPLCARCSGMYLGAMVGLAYQAVAAKKRSLMPHWSVLVVLGLFVAAFGIDGVNSYLYLLKQVRPGILAQIPNIYVPSNTLRLLTGSGMGLGIAAALFPAFNTSVWSDADERRAFPDFLSFIPLLSLTLLFDLLILLGNSAWLSALVLFEIVLISGVTLISNRLRIRGDEGNTLRSRLVKFNQWNGWASLVTILVLLVIDLLARHKFIPVPTENPLVLYPLAIASALGVWILLTMVYSIVWVMITGQDNKFTTLRAMWLPLLAGLTITLIQTAAIDMLRFWLTGTWGGFPLG